MDLKAIEERYAGMSDEYFKRIVTKDSYGLRPEVFDIINKELIKRNMDPNMIQTAIIQNAVVSDETAYRYADIIRHLPCPECKKTNLRLNAATAISLKGLLILSMKEEEFKIACPVCLDKFIDKVNLSNMVMGWWSTFGFVKTPYYIYKNIAKKKIHSIDHPTRDLIDFIRIYIGEIDSLKNDLPGLQAFIEKQSKKGKYRY